MIRKQYPPGIRQPVLNKLFVNTTGAGIRIPSIRGIRQT